MIPLGKEVVVMLTLAAAASEHTTTINKGEKQQTRLNVVIFLSMTKRRVAVLGETELRALYRVRAAERYPVTPSVSTK